GRHLQTEIAGRDVRLRAVTTASSGDRMAGFPYLVGQRHAGAVGEVDRGGGVEHVQVGPGADGEVAGVRAGEGGGAAAGGGAVGPASTASRPGPSPGAVG